MAQTAEAVLGALASYRAYINGVNRRAMDVIIPRIEAAEDEDENFETSEEMEEARLEFVVDQLLGGNAEPPIQRPSDVVDNWDAIVRQVALDGGRVNPDSEWRAARREAYKTGVLEGLEHLECPDGQWALPADFEILMNEIDSLEGSGWWRTKNVLGGLIFWEGWGGYVGKETAEDIQQRVKDGRDILDRIVFEEDYDVAGGWELGYGNEAVCFAMYSRPRSDESQGWSWRYVAMLGGDGTEVFDDLAGVLDWYKGYNDPDDQDIHIVSEEVWAPC